MQAAITDLDLLSDTRFILLSMGALHRRYSGLVLALKDISSMKTMNLPKSLRPIKTKMKSWALLMSVETVSIFLYIWCLLSLLRLYFRIFVIFLNFLSSNETFVVNRLTSWCSKDLFLFPSNSLFCYCCSQSILLTHHHKSASTLFKLLSIFLEYFSFLIKFHMEVCLKNKDTSLYWTTK